MCKKSLYNSNILISKYSNVVLDLFIAVQTYFMINIYC